MTTVGTAKKINKSNKKDGVVDMKHQKLTLKEKRMQKMMDDEDNEPSVAEVKTIEKKVEVKAPVVPTLIEDEPLPMDSYNIIYNMFISDNAIDNEDFDPDNKLVVLSLAEVNRDIDNGALSNGHEVLNGPVKPVYDCDNKYATEAEQKRCHDIKALEAYDQVVELFKDKPNAEIFCVDSSGYDKSTDCFKNSFGFIVKGAGYYESITSIPPIKNCDLAMYTSKKHNNRLLWNTKETQHRHKKIMIINAKRKITILNKQQAEILGYDLKDYMVQNIDGEELNYVAPIEKKKEHGDIRDIKVEGYLEIVKSNMGDEMENFEFDCVKRNMLIFTRLRSSHCLSCDKTHDKDNTFYVIVCHDGNFIQGRCMRAKKPLWTHLSYNEKEASESLKGDMGMAELFVKYHKDNIKITDVKQGEGYVWKDDSLLWEPCESDEIANLIPQFLSTFYATCIKAVGMKLENKEISKNEEEKLLDIVKAFKKALKLSYGTTNSRKVFTQAKTKLKDLSFVDIVNTFSHLFPIKNGLVVDLKTGKTRERTKADLFSYECNVELTNDKLGAKFISDVMLDNKELISYFQIVNGLFLTGDNNREYYVFHGKGRNGKSTYSKIIQAIFGDYYITLNKDVVIAPKRKGGSDEGAATPHIIPMRGRRLGFCDEVPEGSDLNTKNVKQIASGDKLVARRLYKDEISFQNYMKLCILCNDIPKFGSHETAVMDRTRYIPWLARFLRDTKDNQDITVPEAHLRQEDKKFVDKMQTQEGINSFFTWMVAGAVKFYSEGLNDTPDIVKNYTSSMLAESDLVAKFMIECCNYDAKAEDKPRFGTKSSELFQAFKSYHYQSYNKETEMTQEIFSKSMILKKYVVKKSSCMFWVGIKLKPESTEETD